MDTHLPTAPQWWFDFSFRYPGIEVLFQQLSTSKTPDVAIDERGLVRNVHLFVCVHNAVKYYIVY